MDKENGGKMFEWGSMDADGTVHVDLCDECEDKTARADDAVLAFRLGAESVKAR